MISLFFQNAANDVIDENLLFALRTSFAREIHFVIINTQIINITNISLTPKTL